MITIMITISITFDAQGLSRDDFDKAAQGGTLVGASGLLNLQWEDFSALSAAREIDLHNVTWETSRDDTPGTLTCIIRYENLAMPELQERLLDPSVLEYEICEGSRPTLVAY